MLKKILSVTALMCILFAVSVFADFSYYESYDTEQLDTANMSYYIKSTAGGFSGIKTENGNKYYNFGVLQENASYTERDTFLQTTNVDLTKGKFVFGFSLRFNEVSGNGGSFSLNFRHATNSTTVNNLVFSADGTVKYFGGYQKKSADTVSEKVDAYSWQKFKFVFDIPNETVSVYRNNEKITECKNIKSINSTLANYNYSKLGIRLYTGVGGAFLTDDAGKIIPNKVSLDIDDIYAYNDVSTDENILFSAGEIYEITDNGLYKTTGMRRGDMRLNFIADNIGDKDESITVLKAIYDETGKMIDFSQSAQMNIKAGASNILTYYFSSDYNELDKQMKLMFVNSTGEIKPLSRAKTANGIGNLMPRAAQLRADLLKNHPNNDHPRLWVTQDKFDELKQRVAAKEEPYASWYRKIIASADKKVAAANSSLPKYDDTDELRLKSAGTVCSALTELSFAYKMTGDEKYTEAIKKHIVNASSWPDWNPKHFLDTATVAQGFGFAYDWCYDVWQKEENAYYKNLIITKIDQYGLQEVMKKYTTTQPWGNNWNMVCNGGIAQAATAIMDEPGYEKIASECVAYGLEWLLSVTDDFAPDGGWYEGTGYWSYLMEYMSVHFDTLQAAFGGDYDYTALEGISETGYFPIAMIGNKQTFNIHDASAGNFGAPYWFFLAKQYNNKDFAMYRYKQIKEYNYGATLYDLIWFEPELVEGYEDYEFTKKDFYFENVSVASFRDDYFKNNKMYAALHGGKNNFAHGQLDSGNFIYEYNGVRWALDLGGDNYNLHAYFNTNPKSEKSRWSYYRNRAEGHNTVILNPGLLADQDPNADTKFTYFDANDQKGIAVLDMYPAMKNYVSSAKRGMYFDKSNAMMLLRDEIDFNTENNTLYWFMHTGTDIKLAADGKSAVLTFGSRKLWVGIVDGDDCEFSVESATPLETSPNPDEWAENMDNLGDATNPKTQNANEGIKKLQIKKTNLSGRFNLTVMFMPLTSSANEPEYIPENLSIESWINQ